MSNKLPICQCCDLRPVGVLMKIGTRKSDWAIQSCDMCLDAICDECADIGPDAVVCRNCLQQQALTCRKVFGS